MDVHIPIPYGSCCSFIICSDTRGVESITTPLGLYTLFQGADEITVVNLLRLKNRSLILCICFFTF